MARLDATDARCHVLTYKQGLLSAVAHDLQLSVTDFSLEVDREAMAGTARFNPRSLRVDHALKKGTPDPTALSPADRQKIEQTIAVDVLKPDRFPEIVFESTEVVARDGGYQVSGILTLCGVQRPLVAQLRSDAGRLRGEVVLHQPDFGIKPFRAALGGLKIQADVRIRLDLPAV